jgi:hypothetical protein
MDGFHMPRFYSTPLSSSSPFPLRGALFPHFCLLFQRLFFRLRAIKAESTSWSLSPLFPQCLTSVLLTLTETSRTPPTLISTGPSPTPRPSLRNRLVGVHLHSFIGTKPIYAGRTSSWYSQTGNRQAYKGSLKKSSEQYSIESGPNIKAASTDLACNSSKYRASLERTRYLAVREGGDGYQMIRMRSTEIEVVRRRR